MTARALMIQGTGSDVGKSMLVAALCRLARQQGLSVAPFKPQNMSNNAAVCADGGEIGRAQALQALAAGLAPSVDFNPVLLKPQSDRTAQIVVHGVPVNTLDASDYMGSRDSLLPQVLESFTRLGEQHDLIIVEGAGSPAEINLRERDIANMGFARAAGVPVCLLGDIDRGGVIAAVVGTQSVMDPEDAAYITGFAINKFRGDPSLFVDGYKAIEQKTGWPCYGVIPWLAASARLPAEDGVSLESGSEQPIAQGTTRLKIVAPMLSRLANFDDADPLRQEPNVDFRFVPPGQPLPRDADAIILFGTKSTLGDLAFLRAQGWHHDILAHARAGGRVLGLCGGYQMLGRRVDDPLGLDGELASAEGLGLLSVSTQMTQGKAVREVSVRCAHSALPVTGYEIHTGETSGPDTQRPMFSVEGFVGEGFTGEGFGDGGKSSDGARSLDGRIEGCYVHGLFVNDAYRAHWLGSLRTGSPQNDRFVSQLSYNVSVEAALDEVAAGVAKALDIERLFGAAKPAGWTP